MSQRAYFSIAGLILLALIALLIYSLDRTSWLLAQYELSQPGTLATRLGLAPLALGVAAALVIEIGAIALVGGDVLARTYPEIKRYASAGLFVVLAVQALANLLAGFVRGYQAMLATLTAHDANVDIAWWVAGFAWLLSSVAVPALIFILSKLAALTLRLALEDRAESPSATLSAQESPLEALQERLRASDQRELSGAAPAPESLAEMPRGEDTARALERLNTTQAVSARNGHTDPSAPLEETSAHRYACPHCQAPLASKQAVGAAVKNGYCLNCKAERKAI